MNFLDPDSIRSSLGPFWSTPTPWIGVAIFCAIIFLAVRITAAPGSMAIAETTSKGGQKLYAGFAIGGIFFVALVLARFDWIDAGIFGCWLGWNASAVPKERTMTKTWLYVLQLVLTAIPVFFLAYWF